MRLVDKVEVSYFRSLHSADLAEAGDLNILFGRNDSGKSNLLRALNLFFNYETDVDRDPDFGIDFSDLRRLQAQRGSSRQFFSIRVQFRVPNNYRKSLGQLVSVKRQWNRDGEVTDIYPPKISKGSRIQLTKFLSSVDYTYVPAIKDIETFSRLVQRMYDAAAESQNLQSSTESFINSIRSATDDLSSALSQTLGSPTKLAAPNDMGELFKSLDFSHGDDEHSLLLQKGDGVKARHIPELLRYINEKESAKRFFIWGFEEPENSLDLGAAISEAKRFAEFATRSDTQVFITSHSPAFYLAGGEAVKPSVRRYFVSKQILENNNLKPKNAISPIDTVAAAEAAMGSASLYELPYVIRRLSELQKQRDTLASEMTTLRAQIEEIRRPSVFVEGESKARCLGPFLRIELHNASVRKLRGTPSTTSELLKKVFESGGSLADSKTVFLFDNDIAGRKAFMNIAGKADCSVPFRLNDSLAVCCLERTEEFDDFLTRFRIPKDQSFFPLEFTFDGAVAAQVLYALMSQEHLAQSRVRIRQEYHECLPQHLSHALRTCEPGSADWFWSRGVPNDLKGEFFKDCEAAAAPSTLGKLVLSLKALLT